VVAAAAAVVVVWWWMVAGMVALAWHTNIMWEHPSSVTRPWKAPHPLAGNDMFIKPQVLL